MFDANQVVIDAFVDHAREAYRETCPGLDSEYEAGLERAARTALGTLRKCDCPYHDLEHTLLVTDAGMAILRGRQLSRGNLSPSTWLQAVVAMLFHDVGYLRGLLREDREGAYLTDDAGNRITPRPGSSDAVLMPYHVVRGGMFVMERFAGDAVIDGPTVASHIEMTRFPVPHEAFYQQLDSVGAMVRAADLIGQMGDPAYPRKQGRLFAEFKENGEADRLGYQSPAELRADFSAFFYSQVHPYLPAALGYLSLTQDGEQWIANLTRHLHGDSLTTTSREALMERSGSVAKPHIAVNND